MLWTNWSQRNCGDGDDSCSAPNGFGLDFDPGVDVFLGLKIVDGGYWKNAFVVYLSVTKRMMRKKTQSSF